MGVRYQKYRSIAIPLNIGIELSQVLRYFDISNIEPALIHICVHIYIYIYIYIYVYIYITHIYIHIFVVYNVPLQKISHDMFYK